MSIKVGDKVKFLNDIGGGIVTDIDKNIVKVRNEDGFDIPVLLREVIKVEETESVSPVMRRIERNEEVQDDFEEEEDEAFVFEEPKDDVVYDFSGQSTENEETNIFLAFVPDNTQDVVNSDLDLYLINDSDYYVLYNIMVANDDNVKSISEGRLEANTKFHLTKFGRDTINKIGDIRAQLIFYKKGTYEPISPLEKIIEIKPVKFFKRHSYIENDFFHEDSILYNIYNDGLRNEVEKLSKDDLRKILKEKQESDVLIKQLSQRYKTQSETTIVEVDLHVQELVDDVRGMSNAEILGVQMDHFHKELNKAISTRVDKIVFIHGVGNGTLKTELRKALDREYKKITYHDASFKEYGYGATLIIIK